jgi:hypothetical protein
MPILMNKLFDAIKQSMEDAEVEEDSIVDFFKNISKLSEDEILSILAIPLEVQQRLFLQLANQIRDKKTTVGSFVKKLSTQAKSKGYRLGFHVSTKDFKPTKIIDKNGSEIETWEVPGSENDHRDDDLLRAYYSLDYQNLYRKKQGENLYLVRAETGPSGHKTDEDGSWARAARLPIIAKLNLPEVDQRIEERLKK